jgi:hypothetical protein
VASSLHPSDRASIFEPPNLLTEEDPAAYESLRTRVFNTLSPRDLVEEMYSHDVTELTWEIRRWRGAKKAFIANETLCALEEMITSIASRRWSGRARVSRAATELVKKWAGRDPDAIRQVDELLSSAQMTIAAVEARVITAKSGHIERMDRIISTAVKGRKTALREIDHHQQTFAQALSDKMRWVEDEVASDADIAA